MNETPPISNTPPIAPERRTPAYLQRLKADALMEAVGGLPTFPLVAETLRECFNDALDVPRLKRLLARLGDGEMWTRHVDTPLPSPFVYPLLLAWDWAYLDAGHAEERRSDAVPDRTRLRIPVKQQQRRPGAADRHCNLHAIADIDASMFETGKQHFQGCVLRHSFVSFEP